MEYADYMDGDSELLELDLEYGKGVIGDMFDGYRIDEETIPEGSHLYFIEHRENEFSTPLYIRKNPCLVNFMGSFVTESEIDFGEDDELRIVDYNWIV